jgi:cation diffusion facilitator CzcD-associated flavoprotein CzcO
VFLLQEEIEEVEILVIGSGPTGLGAATRLQQHGHPSWLMIDAFDEAGGCDYLCLP